MVGEVWVVGLLVAFYCGRVLMHSMQASTHCWFRAAETDVGRRG